MWRIKLLTPELPPFGGKRVKKKESLGFLIIFLGLGKVTLEGEELRLLLHLTPTLLPDRKRETLKVRNPHPWK